MLLLSNKSEELQKLDTEKTKHLTSLTMDMSIMQHIIDQKSSEV